MSINLDPRSVVVPVASSRNAKLAALYFDYVVPLYCDDTPRELLPPQFGNWEPPSSTTLLKTIGKSVGAKRFAISIPNDHGVSESILLTLEDGSPDFEAVEYVNQWFFINRPEMRKRLTQQMRRALIEWAPVLLSSSYFRTTEPARSASDVTATLTGLPIVDVSHTSWQQILEFRNDKEEREKLRILRLHLANEYIGKSHEQIAAGLQLSIEQCERAAKKHGFDLIVGSLQAACDTKELLGTVGLFALVGTAIGGTQAGTAAGATVGLITEFAKVILTVAKGSKDMRDFRQHHPLSYVIDAKDRL